MENAIKRMDEKHTGVYQIVYVMDFADYGQRHKSPESKKVAKNSQDVLQNQYPERMGATFIINPPWFYSFMFTLVSPFLSARTKQKIHMLTGNKTELVEKMKEFMPEDQIEVAYGGKNDFLPKEGVDTKEE